MARQERAHPCPWPPSATCQTPQALGPCLLWHRRNWRARQRPCQFFTNRYGLDGEAWTFPATKGIVPAVSVSPSVKAAAVVRGCVVGRTGTAVNLPASWKAAVARVQLAAAANVFVAAKSPQTIQRQDPVAVGVMDCVTSVEAEPEPNTFPTGTGVVGWAPVCTAVNKARRSPLLPFSVTVTVVGGVAPATPHHIAIWQLLPMFTSANFVQLIAVPVLVTVQLVMPEASRMTAVVITSPVETVNALLVIADAPVITPLKSTV